jgi:hypothetical protein
MRGRSTERRIGRRLTLVLALLGAASLAGCGDNQGGADGGDGADGCVGAGTRLLSVVGDPSHVMYPEGQADLKVVLLERCVGAVAGQQVEFSIVSNPGDSSLSSPVATTEATGLAKVTLTAGERTGRFQVWARSADDPAGVYFSIDLKPVMRVLQPVGQTTLETYIGQTLELTVKVVDLGTQQPVRGIDVSFAIEASAGDAGLSASQAATSLTGLAKTTFRAGSMVRSYRVTVQGTSASLGSVIYDISVRQKATCQTSADCQPGFECVNGSCNPGGSLECETSDECPPGYSCKDGFCRPDGVLPETCETSDDCPEGYFCENGACFPCDEGSALPECRTQGTGCETDEDCPPGFKCQNGVCVPDNPVGTIIPDVSGTWYTKHFFDIRNSLPGFAQTLQTIISRLNQAINYCHITGIGFVDDFICDLIHEYVPEWVGTLISILDNLSNILSELRAEGEMELRHLNPRELLSGSELWDKILVRYLDACCEGRPRPCNPYQQADFPDCATIDIYREDLQFADVGLQVLPFTAKINVTEGVITTYTLAVDPREVKIEVSKFVVFLLDLMVQIFLGYDSLNDALMDLIDCLAIQDLVDSIWPFGGSAPNIVQTCENLKPNAASLLTNLLNQIGVGWKALRFSGWATLGVEADDPPYGMTLGFTNFETRSPRDGHWAGTFTVIVQGNITGGWFAER